jgi:LysR family transcriptional regulator, regulator for bpeEF and oprC
MKFINLVGRSIVKDKLNTIALFVEAARWSSFSKVFRLPVRGNLAIDRPDAHLSAAIAGIGIVQELSFMVEPAIAKGRLVPLLRDYAAPGETISAIYPQKQYLPAKVRVFLDFLKALMADLKQANLVE